MSELAKSTRIAWAVLSETGGIIHVSALNKEQNGLKCGCECPSCKGKLQAVNVDKEDSHFAKPNSRGKFFRHDSGQQTNGCAVIAARMAALRLLYEHDSIDLPAPTRQVAIHGASGHQYAGFAEGKRLRVKIRYREWVDEQTARLTTDDGRIIQIQLSSVTLVNSEGVHGVIEVRVDDPEVSSWSPQRILAQATLDGGMSCWIRHWDDHALTDAARRDAEDQAADNSDFIPPELAHLVGQATSLLSESVLHWVVKEILAEARSIRTPSYTEQVTSTYPSSFTKDRTLHWNPGALQLREARLEQHIANVVPDIRCQARDSSGNTFDVFVEVVVTNPVSKQKLAKIREIGIACLEIDLGKLHISGRVKRDKLRQAVLEETSLKKWLYHPLIDARRQEVIQSLNIEVQQQEALFKKIEARNDELQSMSSESLLRNFALALRLHWSDSHPKPEAWTMEELTTSLTAQGFSGLSQQVLISKQGLLWHLEKIRFSKSPQVRIAEVNHAELFSMAMRDVALRPYTTLLIRAINRYRPAVTKLQRNYLAKSFAEIRASIDGGELTYARPPTYDLLVSTMYPELTKDIADPVGTIGHARQVKKDLAFNEQQDALREQELLAQQQQVEREEASRIAADQAKLDYLAAFEALEVQVWDQDRSSTLYSEKAQMNVRFWSRQRKVKLSFDKFALVKSAWTARARGMSFSNWLYIQEPKTAEHLQDCTECLVAARLVL